MESNDELREKLTSLYFSSRNNQEKDKLIKEINLMLNTCGNTLSIEIDQLYQKIVKAISKE